MQSVGGDPMKYIFNQINEISQTHEYLKTQKSISAISQAIEITANCLDQGKKIMFAGNGGSAADSQHMAGEFVSRFEFDRPGLAAISLTVDTSVITACGNDYGYEKIFERQINALSVPGDVIWLYTTSGRSKNIILAAQAAQIKGVGVIVFCGTNTSELSKYADCIVSFNSSHTPRIQEFHLMCGHIICGAIEEKFFK